MTKRMPFSKGVGREVGRYPFEDVPDDVAAYGAHPSDTDATIAELYFYGRVELHVHVFGCPEVGVKDAVPEARCILSYPAPRHTDLYGNADELTPHAYQRPNVS